MSRYTRNFSILQGCYWIAACFLYAFAERFLLARGFTVQEVGIVLAVSNGAALLLQPLLAALADRPNGLSLRAELSTGAGLAAALSLLLCFPGQTAALVAVLFGSLAALTVAIQPLANAVGLAYLDRGERINYSLARGIASALFGGYCYAAGFLAEWNSDALLWCFAASSLGLMVSALAFAPKKEPSAQPKEDGGAWTLFLKHRSLWLLLPATVLIFTVHNFINAYMLSIVSAIGGGTHEMSVAIALAAILEIPTMAGFSLLQKRFRLKTLLFFSAAAFLFKHLLLLLPLYGGAGVWAVYASQSVQLLGYAIFIPASSFFLNERMDAGDKVKGQMLLTESQTLGCILGQLLGGFSIASIAVGPTLLIGGALTAVGTALMGLALWEKKKPDCQEG